MASFGSIKQAIFDKQARKQQYQDHIRGLNAFDRHKKFLNDYAVYYGEQKSARETLPVKTDQDTIREGYRFIMSEEDDMHPSWEQRLVKRYYDKLFKELPEQLETNIQLRTLPNSWITSRHMTNQYCIADMSHYKTGKIGLRWRVEKEVISGKGQFVCGNKHCDQKEGLSSYEVNFSYFEAGENKQALVKLVACERCAEKLYYKKQKEKEQLERKENEKQQRKRNRSESDDDTSIKHGKSKERMKGDKSSTSDSNHKPVDEENFDEYLSGMFP